MGRNHQAHAGGEAGNAVLAVIDPSPRFRHSSSEMSLLRCSGRFFDQGCHLAGMQKKNCVAAHEFDRLGLGSLRHEPFKVRVDHSVLCWKAAT